MLQSDIQKQQHIVVLTGMTLEGSGMNSYVWNVAIQWKKMGYKVSVICQDRNARIFNEVDSYIQGELPIDAPILQRGQIRVIVPDINNLIPIYAKNEHLEIHGVQSKTVQNMTDQEIETNISMTVSCLQNVCKHDRPFKVIANYILFSGIIAARGLTSLKIPFDIIILGPGLIYSVYPYPHLHKWVIPGLKKASVIYNHTQLVKTQFLKCFKNKIQELNLIQKSRLINPGINPNKLTSVSTPELQHQFLTQLASKLKHNHDQHKQNQDLIKKEMDPEQMHQVLKKEGKFRQIQLCHQELLEKWKYSPDDEIIVYVGALLDTKGVGQLLTIAPKLIAQRPTLKFIFCGSGPYRQHMEYLLRLYEQGDIQQARLLAQAGTFITQVHVEDHFIKIDKKIRDRIIFAGLLNQELIHKLLPFCSIYVSPIIMKEAHSTGIIEALCCGVTPICNNHSWFSQVLNTIKKDDAELTQIIKVDRNDFFDKLPTIIIDTLDYIKQNKLSKTQYRNKLRSIAVNNYSWNSIARQLAQVREYTESE